MEGGVRVREEPGRRPRITLLDQMSAIAADGRDLSGLTLDDILKSQMRAAAAAAGTPPPPETSGRTLLDIIRDEDPKASSFKGFVNRDKKPWRSFKERIRLRRSGSGAAWTSSVHVPTSDILVPASRSLVARRSSVRGLFSDPSPSPPRRRSLEPTTSHLGDGDNDSDNDGQSASAAAARPQISRRTSCRLGGYSSFSSESDDRNDAVSDSNSNSPRGSRRGGPQPASSLRPQISRRQSTRFSPAMDDSVTDHTEPLPPQREGSRRLSAVLAEERSLSAREAVAAQEAAEAAAFGESSESFAVEAAAAAPVRMSLMDLLEETDRQLGFVGSRYLIGEDDDEDDYDEEVAEEIAGGGGTGAAAVELNCCVCMVRHKGAAFIPCGHTFCRLCSRELWVSRGNCPLCNGFILEILDIF